MPYIIPDLDLDMSQKTNDAILKQLHHIPASKLNDKGIRCFTADTFIETNNKISAVDMELWYICNFGFKNVKSYKIVSDNLSLDKYLNFDFNKDWQILNERVKNEFTTT